MVVFGSRKRVKNYTFSDWKSRFCGSRLPNRGQRERICTPPTSCSRRPTIVAPSNKFSPFPRNQRLLPFTFGDIIVVCAYWAYKKFSTKGVTNHHATVVQGGRGTVSSMSRHKKLQQRRQQQQQATRYLDVGGTPPEELDICRRSSP